MGFLNRVKKTVRSSGPDVTCRTVLPLKDHLWIDMNEFFDKYRSLWGDVLPFKEAPVPGDIDQRIRRFVVGDAKNRIMLSVVDHPLPESLVSLLSDAPKTYALQTMKFDESDKTQLRNHKAHIMIEITTNADNAPIPAQIVAWVTLCFTRFYPITGYAPQSAQAYRTSEWVNSLITPDKFDAASLFIMLCNHHMVRNGENWIHTHGMEQFGLPDVEVFFDDQNQYPGLLELVSDMSIYMIENGPVMAIGHTTQSRGEDAIYRVVEPRINPQHPYGRFGALGLRGER